MAVVKVLRTRDGRYRVYLHQDQTAELSDEHGRLLLGRVPLHRIGARLAELGIDGEDLVED